MKLFNKSNLPVTLSAIVLIVASIYYLSQSNYEFLIYTFSLAFLIVVLYLTNQYFNFIPVAKWCFLFWLISHMAGGWIYFGDTRLYDLILIPIFGAPYHILRYDQFVHFICYIAFTLLMYSVLIKITKPKPNKIVFAVVLVLAASSFGAVNEMIEFGAVVILKDTGVGDFYNMALDLVFNFLGSLLALPFLFWKRGSVFRN